MNNKTLRTMQYVPLGVIGAFLIGWAAFQLIMIPKAEACTQQDCSSSWTVLSNSCDDLFQCGCGSNCTATQNTCYRERGYCNGSPPSNDIVFRKCYLGQCPCPSGGSGGCHPDEDCEMDGGFWQAFTSGCDYPVSSGCQPGTWGFTNPHYDCNGQYYDCICDMETPILIDVNGNGFALTSALNGVNFDMDASGGQKRLGWTIANSDDAFLVLDQNGNGTIDNGAELFGNYTAQPEPPAGESKNGFLALSEYDKPANGGNGDGKIEQRDAIFSSLRLWVDTNHNGVSEAAELHSLSQLGLITLELDYKTSKRTDEYGNKFRYRAKVRGVNGNQAGRWAWDVFLVVAH